MSAINFVVRDVAGNISRGSVAEEGGPSSFQVGSGADISLNLSQGQIVSYTRNGQSLEVTLIDGRVVVIDGFFGADGTIANDLFLSSNGYLTEVDLTQGAGADYFANYLADDGIGKFAVNDDLYFMREADVILADAAVADDEVGMLAAALAAPLLGWGGAAAAAAAGAAVIAGGGGGGDDGIPAPDVEVSGGTTGSNQHIVNEEDHADGVEIDGVGTAGAEVAVTVDGVTEVTTVAEDGTWGVVFAPEDVAEGEYTTDVSVTITNDGGSTTVTDTLVVDTVIGADITQSGGSDGVINAAEYDGGVTLTGAVTGGDSIVVTIDGVDYDAVVSGSSWSLDVDPAVLGEGEYSADIVVTATDAAGNSFSTSGTVVVDTLIGVSSDAVGGADGVINAVDFGSGVTLTGAVTGNDAVTVTIGGQSFEAVVTYDDVANVGTWTLSVPTSVLGEGEYTENVVVTTTDAAGNTASASMVVEVDTLIGVDVAAAGGADGTINAAEFGSGVVLNGAVTGNDAVTVTINGQDFNAVVSYDEVTNVGTWTLAVPTAVLGEGEYTENVTVTTTDAAGNSASASMTVVVDTLIGVDSNATGGADGVINGVEFGDGVVLSGGVTGNDAVVVTIDGQDFNAVVSYDEVSNVGTWTLAVPTAVLGEGEYTQNVTVTTTDAAGNVASTVNAVEVDTFVNELETTAVVAGDDVVNGAELEAGLTLGGTVEGNSTVVVTFAHPDGNIVRDATVDASGNWSVSYAGGEVPSGDYTANITISATDEHGNVDSITDTFRVDTVAPDAPHVEAVTITDAGVRSIEVQSTDDDYTVNEINGAGDVAQLSDQDGGFDLGDVDLYRFDPELSDGSHLIVNETDASGNSNATYVVLEESGTDTVSLAGLDGFDVGAIDLSFATDSELTLDLSTLEGLSDNDNNLVIHGGAGDSVDLTGATNTGQSETIEGKSYDLYTTGDDAQIFIDEDINVTI